VRPREYMNADQLAAVTPWSRKAIEHLVAKGLLVRGRDYFQPQGPRTPLIFKWSAIVQFIEGGGDAAPPAPGGRLDVEAATAALERLLARKPRGPAPAAPPQPRIAHPVRARHRAP
jgi:hypothetical protein